MLTVPQIQEFDETGWITLTPDQKSKLQQRTGIAPTRVRPIDEEPCGEVAELGYNMALKTAVDEIKVLHEFLMSDKDVVKKGPWNAKIVAASHGTTKDIPTFAIDSKGKLWKWVSRKEFTDYVERNPKNIQIIYLHLPGSMPSKNTVASADALRQVTDFAKRQNVPMHVISEQ